MKKLVCVFLSALLMVSAFAGCSRVSDFTFCPDEDETGADVHIVSFNVAAPWGNVLKGTSGSARVKRFAAYMNAVKPDSIGTQEMNSEWMEKLKELLTEYDSYGVQRGGDDNEKKSEMNSIFWLKDKYNCIDSGTFWLSDTPDVESKYEGAGCYRICSYVLLENRETGECYYHFNTHLDNASDEARVFGAQVINDKIFEKRVTSSRLIQGVVLTGDFNDYLDGPASSQLAEKFNVQDADRNTYHDWGNITEGKPIDFIFTTGDIVSYSILDDMQNGLVSDHYGVYETIKFEK